MAPLQGPLLSGVDVVLLVEVETGAASVLAVVVWSVLRVTSVLRAAIVAAAELTGELRILSRASSTAVLTLGSFLI